MGKFGGKTPKRHRIWSNCEALVNGILDEAGYMSKDEMKRLTGKPTVFRFIDKNGVRRHTGVQKNLKKSQRLDLK